MTRDFKTVEVWGELENLNPDDVIKRSLAKYDTREQVYTLRVVDEEYSVDPKKRVVEKSGERASWQLQLLAPIYLVNARDEGLAGRLISPRELVGGDLFFSAAAHKLAFGDLLNKYGSLSRFLEAGSALGGETVPLGDGAFKILVLPRIPLFYIYRVGGEEFPNSIEVLFDASAKSHLPTDSLWLIIEYSKKRLLDLTGSVL